MSKPEEIIQKVEVLTNESFHINTWVGWANDVLSDLTVVLNLETYDAFSLVDEDNRVIAGDIYDVVRFVVNEGDNDKEYKRVGIGDCRKPFTYWIWEGKVCFPSKLTGNAKMWYYRYPAKLTLGSASADIPDRYEDVLILGMAAKSKAPDRWLEDKNDFIRDYVMRKMQIQHERNINIRRPHRIGGRL